MADLAGPARTLLDPACGTGALLCAVSPRPDQELYAQDSVPELAALTALRLALHSPATVRGAMGDTLRADAHPGLRADAVLCHPPFNERNWGHDELAYDPRWEYGFPARNESELAWVQHALARLKDGGTAVLLMPPAAASRRSGPPAPPRPPPPPPRPPYPRRPAAPGRAARRRRPADRGGTAVQHPAP